MYSPRQICSSILVFYTIIIANGCVQANPDGKRLYDDLLSSYNRLVRPVINNTDNLTVKMGLKLTQLIDLNMKSQILSTNVWVPQEWYDHKLTWNPDEYGGVKQLYVPAEQIWLPDIVLYNNADGNYEIVIMTKAKIHWNGRVEWNPPSIYKSSCNIDINYFPYDYQDCHMKFGSWTYHGYHVDLKHMNDVNGTILDETVIDVGIDLSEFYLNVEWDIMRVPARRKFFKYSCCPEIYPDITFNLTLRRKTLFYTINLIIPCVSISCLSVLVFYLPSDSGEKVTLSISILLSLTFFFLVLIEIIPSTSLAIPLLGKYLIFTMVLVTLSVIVTILVLNIHFRSPSTHRMSPWVRRTFMHTLPKLLLMRPPQYKIEKLENTKKSSKQKKSSRNVPQQPPNSLEEMDFDYNGKMLSSDPGDAHLCYPQRIDEIIKNAIFIAQHIDNADEYKSNQEDWKYVSMVLDRFFLWIFTISCIVGTGSILMMAPSIYDLDVPLDIQKSKIAKSQF